MSTGCCRDGVVWISICRQGTYFAEFNGYHSHTWTIILRLFFYTIFTHSAWLCPYKISSGHPTTLFLGFNFHIIAGVSDVNAFPQYTSAATSASCISKSQTNVLTISDITETLYARYLAPGRHGIEYMLPGTWSFLVWWMRQALSSGTALSRRSCSNLLLIVLWALLTTDLQLFGSRTSAPSSTCSWTTVAPGSVFFASSMIIFSCSKVSWADVHIL